jgi:choloylglycine hydrolase
MCTDFLLAGRDGRRRLFVNGRSMDFGLELNSQPFARRRGEVMQSPAPRKLRAPRKKHDGLRWRVKYGYVGMNVFKLKLVVDGLNECGLSVGTLWLPGSEYQTVTNDRRALSVLLVNDWLLGTCATVADVRRGLRKVQVWAYTPMEKNLSPIHFTVHDARGKSIVIEYLDGKLNIFDNPVGTTTNAPVFPWHLDNVRNYVGVTPNDRLDVTVFGKTFTATGNGTGFRGIPGDYTPPSRFIRTLFLASAASRPKDARVARNLALHILNNVDIRRARSATRTSRARRTGTTPNGSPSRT